MNAILGFLKGGGWIIIVAGIAIGWIQSEIRAAETRGKLIEQSRVVDSLASANLDSAAAWQARDSAQASAIAALTADLDSMLGVNRGLQVVAHRATQRAAGAIEELRDRATTAADSGLVVVVDSAIGALETANEACNAGLVTCDRLQAEAQLSLRDARQQALDLVTTVEAQRRINRELTQQVGKHGFRLREGLAWGVAVVVSVLHFVK